MSESESDAGESEAREAALDADYDTGYTGNYYGCGLDGKCEKQPRGKYSSLEKCQAECTAAENKDLIYQILAYEPDRAGDLPPSGRIRVVKEIIGIKVSARKADKILLLFRLDDWANMRKEKLLEGYFQQLYTPLQLLTRDLISLMNMNPDLITDYGALEQKVFAVLQDYLRSLSEYNAAEEAGEELEYDETYERDSDLNGNLMELILKKEAIGTNYSDDVRDEIDDLIGDERAMAIVEDELSRRE